MAFGFGVGGGGGKGCVGWSLTRFMSVLPSVVGFSEVLQGVFTGLDDGVVIGV